MSPTTAVRIQIDQHKLYCIVLTLYCRLSCLRCKSTPLPCRSLLSLSLSLGFTCNKWPFIYDDASLPSRDPLDRFSKSVFVCVRVCVSVSLCLVSVSVSVRMCHMPPYMFDVVHMDVRRQLFGGAGGAPGTGDGGVGQYWCCIYISFVHSLDCVMQHQ